jgi:antitoxin PrlF
MRVTTKGQVTISQRIREKPGITSHSEVEFVEESGRVYIRKVEGRGAVQDWFARCRGSATVRMSTDEILRLTRGE